MCVSSARSHLHGVQESEASYSTYMSSIGGRGLMTPGANLLALQTDPLTPNVLKRMFVVSPIRRKKTLPQVYPTAAVPILAPPIVLKIRPTSRHC